MKLLFSSGISIYFSIIRIRKYVIKRFFITSVTQIHVVAISKTIIPQLGHQRLEIDRKTYDKVVFYLKYHLLHQDNFLAHLLCHVTYDTSFNKSYDHDLKLAIL